MEFLGQRLIHVLKLLIHITKVPSKVVKSIYPPIIWQSWATSSVIIYNYSLAIRLVNIAFLYDFNFHCFNYAWSSIFCHMVTGQLCLFYQLSTCVFYCSLFFYWSVYLTLLMDNCSYAINPLSEMWHIFFLVTFAFNFIYGLSQF